MVKAEWTIAVYDAHSYRVKTISYKPVLSRFLEFERVWVLELRICIRESFESKALKCDLTPSGWTHTFLSLFRQFRILGRVWKVFAAFCFLRRHFCVAVCLFSLQLGI